MDEKTWASQRSGARFFSITFQILALVTLFGTMYLTIEIANLGWKFGLSTQSNVPAWIVFGGGLLISASLSAIGYGLGILCAIYDRQKYATYVAGADSSLTPSQSVSDSVLNWISGETSGPVKQSKLPTASWTPPPIRTGNPQAKQHKPHGNWPVREWLTRERHFRQPKED